MTEEHDTFTAEMPMPAAGPQMRMVDVTLIEESLTNPRKHFDQAKLGELADSIAASGVHQPVLLRPLPGSRVPETFGFRRQGAPLPEYELVAGARRLRACRVAKVASIPAMIRELTDVQVVEIQIVENLQREDVTELEEAEGYEVLMRQSGLTVDQVGAKIGKSRSYVYARLKVLDLCHQAREALREGKIDFSKGLLIARIPDEALQLKALHFCSTPEWREGDPPSYRECALHVQREFMLKLDSARFKITDASLVPAAGSCRDCAKRTGANPDLFQDVKGADVCTDPKCFHSKEEAASALLKSQALERGQTIIEGREAKALMPTAYSTRVEGYLRLDDAQDSPTDKPLRKLIGKAMEQAGVQPTLVANPHKDGEIVAVLLPEQVAPLLAAAGHAEAAERTETNRKNDVDYAARKAKDEAKRAYESDWRAATLQAIATKIGHDEDPPVDVLVNAVALAAAEHFCALLNIDRAKMLAKMLGLGKVAPKNGVKEWLADHPQPLHALAVLVAHRDVEYRHWLDNGTDAQNADLLNVAAALDVHIESVKRGVKAKHAAVRKAEMAAAPEGTGQDGPAAQASPTRGKTMAKGARADGPAAPAQASPARKLTKGEAAEGIAAALRDAEQGADQGTAAGGAGQGSAGSPDTPAEADAAWPTLKPADDSTAVPASGDARPQAITVGARVRVNAHAKAVRPKSVGREGDVVEALQGQQWRVRFREPKKHDLVFDADELDLVDEGQDVRQYELGEVVKVKPVVKGNAARSRKAAGRVGVVVATSNAGMVSVRMGPGGSDVYALEAADVDPYDSRPLLTIGGKVRTLQIGTLAQPSAYHHWQVGTINSCTSGGWAVSFPNGREGLYEPVELEVLP